MKGHTDPALSSTLSVCPHYATPTVDLVVQNALELFSIHLQMDWSNKTVATVIDVVDTPTPPLNFPGFYISALPSRCYDNSGHGLVLSCHWGSYMDITIVDIERSKVTRVVDESKRGTWTVLDVNSDLVVAQFANPSTAPQLVSLFDSS